MSWLRISPGDIQQVFTSPCPCGRTGLRYKVVGRTDDMLKVKGAIVYPTMVDGVVGVFVPKVTGQFRIVLTEKATPGGASPEGEDRARGGFPGGQAHRRSRRR